MLKFTQSSILVVAILLFTANLTNADAVSDWNAIAVQAVVTAGTARPGAAGSLDIAMVHAATYDAVQAIEKEYQPYYTDIPNAAGSPIAAAAKAARDVLVNRFPAQAASIDVTYQNYLLMNGIGPADPGIAVGTIAAASLIASRSCDGAFPSPAPPPFVGGTGIGVWRPTPPANSPMNPGPWLGAVAPFVMTRPSQFRSPPPPALNTSEYRKDYDEVKSLGSLNSTTRTAAQTDQAQFWAGNFVVMMNKMVRDQAIANNLDISESSRLFALASVSMADASIGVWDDKSYYVYWRPITAIQNGDIDGNPGTVGDPTWTPLIATPPYPDYSSGANGLTGSATRALQNYFKADRMKITVTTTNTGPTNQDSREFDRTSAVAQEVVDARILLGIHFRFADEAARTLGRRVADYAYKNYFRSVDEKEKDKLNNLLEAGQASVRR